MKRAQRMDAVKEEKFYFRTNITTTCTEVNTEPTIKGNAIFYTGYYLVTVRSKKHFICACIEPCFIY